MANEFRVSYSSVRNKACIQPINHDFTVFIENRQFPCHTQLLASLSDYFRNLFAAQGYENFTSLDHMADVDAETFDIILEFAYTKKLHITPENTFAVLKNAHVLGMPPVIRECQNYMKANPQVKNIWSICAYANDTMRNLDLSTLAVGIIVRNFEKTLEMDDFYRAPFHILRAALKGQVEPSHQLVKLQRAKKHGFPYFRMVRPASTCARKIDSYEISRVMGWIKYDLEGRMRHFAALAVFAGMPETMVKAYSLLIEEFAKLRVRNSQPEVLPSKLVAERNESAEHTKSAELNESADRNKSVEHNESCAKLNESAEHSQAVEHNESAEPPVCCEISNDGKMKHCTELRNRNLAQPEASPSWKPVREQSAFDESRVYAETSYSRTQFCFDTMFIGVLCVSIFSFIMFMVSLQADDEDCN